VIAYVNDVRSSGDQKEIPLQAHALIQLDVGDHAANPAEHAMAFKPVA
jgi:hypothetical protein